MMKRKLLSVLLALTFCLSLLPGVALADESVISLTQTNVTSEGTLTLEDGKSYQLGGNITITKTIEISGTVTLDLNGYVLQMTGNGSVIQVKENGDLILTDSNTGNQTHYFTKGNYSLWTWDDTKTDSPYSVTGGVITGGNVDYGGGVYVSGATFTMEGGNIVGCSAPGNDGNCICVSYGTMYAHGGVVEGTVSNNAGKITSTGTPTNVTAFYGMVTGNGTIDYAVFYVDIYVLTLMNLKPDYTVTFLVGNQSYNTAYVVGNKLVPLKAPTKDGYAFVGWYATDDTNQTIQSFPVTMDETSPITRYTAKFVDTTDIKTAQDLTDAVNAGVSSVKLGADIGISQTLEVNHKIALDLNGYVLKMTKYQRAIQVNGGGDLTLTDSNPTAEHENGANTVLGGVIMKGDAGSDSGGGVYVNGGAFTMKGGNIVDCQAHSKGGGVAVQSGGAFTMENGNIVGCEAMDGSGVYVFSGSTMNAHGGVVEGTVENRGTITSDSNNPPTSVTAFYGEVENRGTINYGVFYGDFNTLGSATKPTINHKVTFLDGTTTKTAEVVGDKLVPPKAPTKDGYAFVGWYATDDTNQTIQSFPMTMDETSPKSYTAKFVDTTDIKTAQDLTDAVNAGVSSVKLGSNIALTTTLEVNHKIALDLNGYVLQYDSTISGSVIQVNKNGDLTLTDSNTDNQKHYFTKDEGTGLWTWDDTKTDSPYSVTGGAITGGYSSGTGGGVNVNGGAFTMEGGNIAGCRADGQGGGVYVEGSGTFTMAGGNIVGCKAVEGNGVSVIGDTMNAHGGVVEGTVMNYGTITSTGTPTTFTTFYGEVTNLGTINYGVFYGGLDNMGGTLGTHFEVTFDLNGGTADTTPGTQYFVGVNTAPAQQPSAPTKDGHTFDGWYNGDTQWNFDAPVTESLTLTAHWTPNQTGGGGGGGSSKPSTPSITVPVSSEKGSVSVKATVKNGTASVEISDKQISQVVSEGAENVTIDLTKLNNVTSVELPAHVIETTSQTETAGLTIALPTGTVSLDNTALNSLPTGKDVTVSVKRVPATDLNEEQQAAVGDMANIGLVFDVEIWVGDEQHTDLNGGTVTISIPYTPKKGENPSKLTVWYIRDDGMIMPMGGYYDEENGCFVFEAKDLPLRVS